MNDNLTSPNLGGLERFAVEPTKIEKPWGHELIWAETDESWLVHSGRARIEMAAVGEKVPSAEVVGPGASFRIPPGTVHRVTGIEDTTIVEVSTPHLQDVVRLED